MGNLSLFATPVMVTLILLCIIWFSGGGEIIYRNPGVIIFIVLAVVVLSYRGKK